MASQEELLSKELKQLKYLLDFTSGQQGFDRTQGTLTNYKTYFALKAINGDVTFGGSTTVTRGTAPSSGDVLLQGDVLYGSFDDIEITAGTLYAYYRD
jgi:hypothetical protein